jgi:integrase
MKAQWEKILAEAGIPLVLRDAEGHVLKDEAGQEIDNKIYFHDFRKTCNSALDEVSPGIGESVLGHASQAGPQRSRVNKKHYLLIAARRIRKAIDKLQQPKGFGRLEEQRRLF